MRGYSLMGAIQRSPWRATREFAEQSFVGLGNRPRRRGPLHPFASVSTHLGASIRIGQQRA